MSVDDVTDRELEVFRHLARGLNLIQIGHVMGIRPHTVKTHIRNALPKLGAHTRAHGVALLIGAGRIQL